VYDFDLHHSTKKSIMQTILESGDVQDKKTNVKACMTDWNIQSQEINSFSRWLENKIYWNFDLMPKFVNTNNSLTAQLYQIDCWGAVYNHGDYTVTHNHNLNHLSFVYFVNTPRGSSPLVFTTSNKKIKAEEGKVVIFNSNLWHHVPKNRCNNRIIIAGNYGIDQRKIINRPF